MKFAILGSGAVGGYFGAKLARAGQDVTFIARGAHLEAIRTNGLEVQKRRARRFPGPAAAESDTAKVGPVDVVIVSVKAYDNATALPMLTPMMGPDTVVLTLQNGVDSVNEVAAVVGEDHVLGGTTYVATALEGPGPDRPDRRAPFDHLRRGVRRPRPHLAARAGDCRHSCDGRHPGHAGGRRARADLGQVRLSRRLLRFHRRVAAGDWPHLEVSRTCRRCSTRRRARLPRLPRPRA